MNLEVLLLSWLSCLAMGRRVLLEDLISQNREAVASSGSGLLSQPQEHRLAALKSVLLASVNPSLARVPMRPQISSRFSRHASASMATLFEAFDLFDTLKCNFGSPDDYQACVSAAGAEPLVRITDDGGITLSQFAQKGIAGGSIATLASIAVVLSGKKEVKERLKCMYCDGTGQISCARCLSTGVIRYSNGDGTVKEEKCPNCKGTTGVMCINCHGTGRSVPEDVFRKLGDEEQGFTEDNFVGLINSDDMGRSAVYTDAEGFKKQSEPKEYDLASTPTTTPSPDGNLKVLFLGIDGVLNATVDADEIRLDGEKVALLRDLVTSDDLQIVLSTSWRRFDSYVTYLLARQGIPEERFIGSTPDNGADDKSHEKRSIQIATWLADHPDVSNFAILDDRPLAASGNLLPHLVHVKTGDGLTEADVEQCRRALRVSRPDVIDIDSDRELVAS